MIKRTVNAFRKKGINSITDLKNYLPYKYLDCTNPTAITQELGEHFICMTGKILKISKENKNKRSLIKVQVQDDRSNRILYVSWTGKSYLFDIIKDWKDKQVIVGGKLRFFKEYAVMSSPAVFSTEIERNIKVFPVYESINGVSTEMLENTIKDTLDNEEDYLEEEKVNKLKISEINEAYRFLHFPKSLEEVKRGKKRIIFDKLLYFACMLEKENRELPKGSPFQIKSQKIVNDMIKNLPFKLTESQEKVYNELVKTANNGIRINALIQGDVGSGKTILAIMMMLSLAESGFQSVIMVPISELAEQHYQNISQYAEKYGLKTAYLHGEMKVKERKETLKGIADGTYSIIVGTHSTCSADVVYKNLGLIVIDEEHKFGVEQQALMYNKAAFGAHTLSMSATPIPRSITEILIADRMKVYNIEKPKERQEIQTRIFNKESGIYKFIDIQLQEGRQCYVISAAINNSESVSMADVKSLDQIYKMYKERFPQYNIQMVSGKTPRQQKSEIINQFRQGKCNILVSTIVIEVGINVPNANVIVINNAERFGLATLHQLRGRVGRGEYKSYCILNSDKEDSEKLKIIEQEQDGFEIAEKDFQLRGSGNVIGVQQSGTNEYVELVMNYPKMFQCIKKIASSMIDIGTADNVLDYHNRIIQFESELTEN